MFRREFWRNFDFWLPTISIALAGLVWAATRPTPTAMAVQDRASAAVTAGVIIIIGLTRYLAPVCCLTPTRPPSTLIIGGVILLAGGAIVLVARRVAGLAGVVKAFTLAMILLFILLKAEPLAQAASAGLRFLTGQATDLAAATDIRWLGFSYIAFRLLHSLRDRLSGRLPQVSLQEFIIYIIFFPALTAGPIDRIERFTKDLRKPVRLGASELEKAGERLVAGIFKKFVLADTLAIIALSPQKASEIHASGWLWLALLAYALRIYFDFSGYTDIAIGLGHLWGIQLPENFNQPYRKPNLTAFWNAWHITLAQWFRAYFFNPVTRALRSSKRKIPVPVIIFVGQTGTMLLIGLWHGINWNFAIWGLWHGIGLFAHNRWTEYTRVHPMRWSSNPKLKRAAGLAGTLLTFAYVTVGWIWFTLPTPEQSWQVLMRLLGFQGG